MTTLELPADTATSSLVEYRIPQSPFMSKTEALLLIRQNGITIETEAADMIETNDFKRGFSSRPVTLLSASLADLGFRQKQSTDAILDHRFLRGGETFRGVGKLGPVAPSMSLRILLAGVLKPARVQADNSVASGDFLYLAMPPIALPHNENPRIFTISGGKVDERGRTIRQPVLRARYATERDTWTLDGRWLFTKL